MKDITKAHFSKQHLCVKSVRVLHEQAQLSGHCVKIIAVYGYILIGGINLDPNFQISAEVMLCTHSLCFMCLPNVPNGTCAHVI